MTRLSVSSRPPRRSHLVANVRNDRLWQARVQRDRQLLRERLTDEQMRVVREVIQVADKQGALEFLVVFGSVGRGEQTEESDLDMYYEAQDLGEPYSRKVGQWQVLALPPCALLDALRAGQEFAFSVVRDGLIVADGGRYREVLIALDEDGLTPKPETEADPGSGFLT
jgi:Polymerase beta, Nucleotidyltransferase